MIVLSPQYELATGKAPYPPWKTVFDQLKSVVEGPPPRLDSTDLSDECKEFTHFWLVRITSYINTITVKVRMILTCT